MAPREEVAIRNDCARASPTLVIANQDFYGRGAGVGRTREVGVALGVAVAVGVGLGVDEPDWAQYLPPVFQRLISSVPPQTIISLPVSTAV